MPGAKHTLNVVVKCRSDFTVSHARTQCCDDYVEGLENVVWMREGHGSKATQ
jgi:hypothetical protein